MTSHHPLVKSDIQRGRFYLYSSIKIFAILWKTFLLNQMFHFSSCYFKETFVFVPFVYRIFKDYSHIREQSRVFFIKIFSLVFQSENSFLHFLNSSSIYPEQNRAFKHKIYFISKRNLSRPFLTNSPGFDNGSVS